MAIDPEISLGVRPPVIAPLQIQSPLEQFAKVQSLRNLMQQGQLGQLNIQQTQLQNQALQEKQRRSQAVADLFTGGTRPTEDHILAVGGPDAAAAIKGLHDADKAKFDALEATNKAITRTALGIKSLPPEQRDFGFRAERSRLVTLNPALAQQIPEQYPGDSWLDSKINEGMNADQYLSAVRADAEAKLKAPGLAADAATKQAESEQKQRQVEASTLAPALARGGVAYQQALAAMPPARAALYQGFQTPRDLLMFASTPTEQITAQQAAATAAETAAQHKVTNENERKRIGLQQQEQGLRQRQFDATYGALVDPTTGRAMDPETAKAVAMQDPVAVSIANYQNQPPSMSRGGQSASLMRKVMAINPDYNAQNWQAQKTMLLNATSGKMGQENRAASTALSHVGLMYDAIDALNNGDLRTLNSIGNRLGLETGKTPAAVFQVIAGKVGPELAQAYGESTGGERKVEKGNFDSSLPPQTLKANIAATAELLAGKLRATKFQFQSTPGFEKRELPMISPEAQAVLTRVGGGSGPGGGAAAAFTVTDPRGTVHTFTTKKQADDFKQAAGIK